jgi:hypothetical protein
MCAIYSSAGAASAPICVWIAHQYIVQSLAFGSPAPNPQSAIVDFLRHRQILSRLDAQSISIGVRIVASSTHENYDADTAAHFTVP